MSEALKARVLHEVREMRFAANRLISYADNQRDPSIDVLRQNLEALAATVDVAWAIDQKLDPRDE